MSSPIYYAVPPVTEDHITIGCEHIDNIWEGVEPLYNIHWKETEVGYTQETSAQLDKPAIAALEREGKYVGFSVRVHDSTGANQLVGYAAYFIYVDHNRVGKMGAREHAIYLHPTMRGQGTASKLLSYAEACLARLGVSMVVMANKAPAGGPDIDKMLKANGYAPTVIYYTKLIGE